MTLEGRIQALVKEAIRVCGSGQALAQRLGVDPTAVTHWKAGRTAPDARRLIKLQDLVKRAACVLIALAGLAQAPESGATGPLWAAGYATGQSDKPPALYVLRIVQRLALWLSKARERIAHRSGYWTQLRPA